MIPREIVLEDQILIVGVSEEIAFCDWLVLVIEVFEGVLVRELNYRVFEGTDLLEHLIRDLRVKTNCAMLELMER
jgi:hypothetical protein